jgi:deoxycytidylate deaminase
MKPRENEVRKIAKKSTHRWAHHVAFLAQHNRIVAVGYNRGSLHAEEMALRKMRMAGGRADRLYSYRIRRDGRLGASKPCSNCLLSIQRAGIRHIYYNDYDGSHLSLPLYLGA